MYKSIALLGVGEIDRKILSHLREDLDSVLRQFNVVIERHPAETFCLDPTEFCAGRGQYDGSLIMDRLIQFVDWRGYFRILGVTEEDLYTRGLDHAFGFVKKPRGNLFKHSSVALISTARFREEFHGKPPNERILRSRILKQALHKLGHSLLRGGR